MRSPRKLLRFAHLLCLFLLWPAFLRADSTAAPDAELPDGARYYGPLLDGKLHGQGRMEWANGDRYEGEFSRGRFSGRGRLQFASGHAYEGEFEDGEMSGKGRMQMLGGSVYTGDFRQGHFNGSGRYELSNGALYVGEFKNGSFDGQGIYEEAGTTYKGEFREGRYWGQGEATLADGGKYSGAFEQGMWQGKGRFENPDAEVFEGDFVKGAFTGQGTYSRADGSRYEGEFLKWRFNGAGKMSHPTGGAYEGDFVDGALTGPGRFSGRDGTLYEGEFKDWHYEGQGRLRLANGDVYEGGFEGGQYKGEGTLTYARPRAGGRTQDKGIWEFGVLQGVDEVEAGIGVEAALYNQRRLLDQTLALLAPRDPDKINLYMLAVAGDGSQEVFRREVEFVRDQFARRFGTQGHVIALINSRTTIETAAMATQTSIAESLKAIAAQMNKEKDILLVYLTSHGSRTHELSLNQASMQLRNLPAEQFAALLRESAIRWKVVIVSACYAGGFIDPVKDDHTLVIAAARHDRRSFGCADENDFTYFGEAFFKDALPQSGSFQEAFEKARLLVEKREAEDAGSSVPANGSNASLPQMYNPAAIEAYLRDWWSQAPR